jgi:hypothetical protein
MLIKEKKMLNNKDTRVLFIFISYDYSHSYLVQGAM